MPTFVRTKVGPRRVGVPIKSFITLASPEVIADFFTNAPPAGVQMKSFAKLAPPEAIANYVMSICRRAIAAPPAGGKEAGTS